LEGTIRAEIMKDPRSAEMTEEQIDLMVRVLAQDAADQGVTSDQISPTERQAEQPASSASCGLLCSINHVFGFSGDDYTIPLALGFLSAVLILFMSLMLHHHHVRGVEPSPAMLHYDNDGAAQ
jgi:hypothetical protein